MIKLWNVKQLSEDLRHGSVTEKDKINYIILDSVLIAIAMFNLPRTVEKVAAHPLAMFTFEL